jgi:hypothetical protein
MRVDAFKHQVHRQPQIVTESLPATLPLESGPLHACAPLIQLQPDFLSAHQPFQIAGTQGEMLLRILGGIGRRESYRPASHPPIGLKDGTYAVVSSGQQIASLLLLPSFRFLSVKKSIIMPRLQSS